VPSARADIGRRLAQSPPQRRVLVVEDEYLIASYLSADLDELGFVVIGPPRNLAHASALASTSALDCALIDIALGEESALPVA
jgi:DNA-binding response OmpR family regulator